MSDQEEFFVNRHGKKVSGDGAVLEETPSPEKVVTPTRPPVVEPIVTKPKKIKKVRGKKQTKKITLILFAVLVALALTPLLGGEAVRARYLASSDGAKNELFDYATKTIVPQQKKQVSLKQLSEAATRVEQIRDNACDGGFTDNLALLYPRAKEAFDKCIGQKQKIAAVAANLRDLESQVRYLDSLAPILDPIAKPAGEEFAIISAQHDNWKAFHEALGKLSPSASQRTAHDDLKAKTKVIVDTWSALNSANNAQDAAAFSDAEKKLSENYEAFRAASAALAAIQNETQTRLTVSFSAL